MSAPGPVDQALWSAEFRRTREGAWRELDRLVSLVERKGVRALGADALARLPVLYRAALGSLSVARAVCLDRNLLEWLETLAARAHLCVYAPRRSLAGTLRDLAVDRFPAAVRAAWPQLALSAAALALGFAIAFAVCRRDLDLYWHFVADAQAQGRDPTALTEDLRATLFADQDDAADGDNLLGFASFLFSHNSRVALLAFGIGILGGVPALLLLLSNGFTLGAMSALFHDRDLAVEWWSWILPHGVTELLAIALGATAGLRLAGGLLFSGPHGRLHALSARARDAGPLVFGTIAMLLLAGLIEGVFRQVAQSVPVRYSLAAASALLWLVYFVRCGRPR